VLLVDDETLALERMQHLLGELPAVEVIGTAQDGESAIERISSRKPDVVFLDIQMPGRSGIAVAEALEDSGRPEVIFVSAFDHYAARAFEVEATDYLLKPVRRDRLAQALQRARRRRFGGPPASPVGVEADHLWVPARHGAIRLPVTHVMWVEAAGDYVLLHTAAKSHMLRATMNEMEERLAAAGLMRVHRSTLVRPEAVIEILRSPKAAVTLVMSDGSSVAVGPSYQQAVLASLGVRARPS
jgi:DNA-binding LytR/AlgR family response regulator